jgi:small-conductance mechanosensitive channel
VVLLFSASVSSQTESAESPGNSIISFLNQTVVWYRQSSGQQRLVSEPNDILFYSDNHEIAGGVVQDAFDFARIRAQALPAEEAASANAPTTQRQRIAQRVADTEQRVKQKQQELEGLQRQVATASGKKRRFLLAGIGEAESEVALYEAQLGAMQNMLKAIGQSEGPAGASGNLAGRIEELARTVPFVTDTGKTDNGKSGKQPAAAESAAAPSLPAGEHQASPAGFLGLISDIFATRRKMNALDDQRQATDSLIRAAKEVRAPLVAQVRELIKKGDQLSSQPNAADPAALAAQKTELDDLTAQYKHLSTALLPLGKQSILLESYQRNLATWRDAAQSQFRSDLKGLVLRLGGLGLILGIVLTIAELWRRATFRYVTDARRRYQFLLLRRILLWSLIGIIVAFAFSNELGALTTFAGLMTAGVAFALQSVLLSMVGYFLLIGKYGVRAGDRVQVAGVVGDVVDIGLVNLHLMEVTGGVSPQPTGRVVTFPNSVVFQAASGMFKPIPGTNFLWHEITVTLAPEADYRRIEQRMLEAANRVYAEYHERIERQRRRMELALRTVPAGTSFTPASRVRLIATGLELSIRYPVEPANAAEIDDRMSRELLAAIGRDPDSHVVAAQIEPKSA